MHRTLPCRVAILATSCLIPFSALAQETLTFTLGEIVIKAMNDGGEGVSATEAANTAGSRVAVNPEDLPRSLSIIPEEYFDSRGARTMEETLAYTAGVTIETFGQDDRYDEYMIRGFNSQNVSNYRDGMPLRTVDWAAWRSEPFGLESVNVLRGATSDLYGINEPGGLVNGVSKRPSFSQSGEVRTTVSSNEGAQVGVDFTGPLSDTLAYRIVGLANRSGTNFDEVVSSRLYFAPSLTWAPTDETSLTVYGQYQKDGVADNYVLLPEYGTRETNPGGQFSPDLYTGNPDYNTIESKQNFVGYELEHALNDTVTFNSRARFSRNDWVNQTEYVGLALNGAFLTGGGGDPRAVDTAVMIRFDVDQEVEQLSADNSLVFDFGTAHGEGAIAVGVDHYSLSSETDFSFGYAGDLNLRTGARTNYLAGSFPAFLPSRAVTDIRQTGLYVSGHADIAPDLKLSGGLRYDDVDFNRSGFTTGLTGISPFNFNIEDQLLSGSLALAYNVTDNFMVYGSAARSSNLPPAGLTAAGANLKIEESDSIEAGLKYISADGSTDINVAVFQTTKKNASFNDPSGIPGALTQVGKVTSTGVEIEGIHDFNNGFSLFGTLSYTRAEISDDPTYDGNRAARSPLYTASLFLQYDVPTVDGLSLGAGARYTGKRFADLGNTYEMKAMTLFDASISYEWNDWKAQLAARNLTDERNVAFCTATELSSNPLFASVAGTAGVCTYTAGREVALTVSRQF